MNDYNMERTPYGAQRFEAEVRDLYPKVEVLPEERDGLGVYRRLALTFGSAAEAEQVGELLVPIMESADSRIIGWLADGDTLSVTFNDGDVAENNEPFHLARIADTLLPATEKKPAKKTAKKATPK